MTFARRMGRAWLVAVVALAMPHWAQGQATQTAADIVPADCDFFSTSLMLREQWNGVANSNAFKKIWNLPFVQMGWAQAQSQPQFEMAMQFLQTPEVVEVLDVLKDGFSKEMFTYGEKGWPVLFDVFADYQQQNLMATITGAMSGKQP